MVTLKHANFGTLRGEEPALSYIDLCRLFAMAANAVNKRPIALLSQADNFPPLTAIRMPVRRMTGVAVEHRDDPEQQYLDANKHQRDLFNMWWKQQGYVSLRTHSRLMKARRHVNIKVGDVCLLRYGNGTYRPCQLLRTKITTNGQGGLQGGARSD